MPSKAAQAALHERLAAASPDYRELQDHISAARTVLLIIALAYAAMGIVAFLSHLQAIVTSPEEDVVARAVLVERCVISAVFLVCWRAARKAPFAALTAATALWVAVQVLTALVVSISLFSDLWPKIVAAVLLFRGIIASSRAERFRRKLRAAS